MADDATLNALELLLDWAMEANTRLNYEIDADGRQFGGNPYLNPVLKAARGAIDKAHVGMEDRP